MFFKRVCVCVCVSYSPGEVMWRLLVQLYLADERVMQLVDREKLSLSALKLSLPARVRTFGVVCCCSSNDLTLSSIFFS